MCGTLLAETTQRARKDHWCCACSVPIPAGCDYVRTVDQFDGRAYTSKWHVECRDEFSSYLRENGEDCGDPWDTWENGPPSAVKQKYIAGPFEERAP